MTLFNWPAAGEPAETPATSPDPTGPAGSPRRQTALESTGRGPPAGRWDPRCRRPVHPGWPEVEVRTSARLRKTSEAKWVGGRIVVSLPSHLKGEARGRRSRGWSTAGGQAPAAGRRGRRRTHGSCPGSQRALPDERSAHAVRWVTNQTARWGTSFISFRRDPPVASPGIVPARVLDAVLVHELAHLVQPNHSPAFHQLADRFPRHRTRELPAGYELGLGSERA